MSADATRTRVERGLYRRDKTYFACATPVGDRTPIWKSLGRVSLSEARRLRDEFVADVKGKRIVRGKATFETVARLWLTELQRLREMGEIRESTVRGYETSVRLHFKQFNSLPIAKISPEAINAWHATRRDDGAATGTIRRDFVALRLIFAHALRHGYAPSNPADLLTRRERPKAGAPRERHLNRDEINRILGAAEGQAKKIIATLIFTGLRVGELRGLRWQHIDFAANLVLVRGQADRSGRFVAAKSDAGEREVILMGSLASMLREHKLRSPFSAEDEPVFASMTGTPIDEHNLRRRILAPVVQAAGLDGVTPHVLRHTFCSLVIDQNPEQFFVAKQMGHSDPSFTYRTYGHLFDAVRHAQKLRDGLDSAFREVLG